MCNHLKFDDKKYRIKYVANTESYHSNIDDCVFCIPFDQKTFALVQKIMIDGDIKTFEADMSFGNYVFKGFITTITLTPKEIYSHHQLKDIGIELCIVVTKKISQKMP